MNSRLAQLSWIIAIILLLIYELCALTFHLTTLSSVVWSISKDYPLVPFLSGLLCGHFFWQRKEK